MIMRRNRENDDAIIKIRRGLAEEIFVAAKI